MLVLVQNRPEMSEQTCQMLYFVALDVGSWRLSSSSISRIETLLVATVGWRQRLGADLEWRDCDDPCVLVGRITSKGATGHPATEDAPWPVGLRRVRHFV